MRVAVALVAIIVATSAIAQDTCQIWGRRKCAALVVQAAALVRTSPKYPRVAKELRQEGVIRVYVDINDRGEVVYAAPTHGPLMFHTAAVQAARKWRFKPARINHRSVPSSTTLTFRFVLSEAF